jgi:hypothetical protein
MISCAVKFFIPAIYFFPVAKATFRHLHFTLSNMQDGKSTPPQSQAVARGDTP